MQRVESEHGSVIVPNRIAVHHGSGAVGWEVIRGSVPPTREIDRRLRGRERQASARNLIPEVVVEWQKSVGLPARCAKRVANPRIATRDAAFTLDGAERSPANVGESANRTGAASREELDHAGHGVGPIRDARGSANDLDAIEVVGGERGEVERATRVVDWHTIDENLDVIAFAAAG